MLVISVNNELINEGLKKIFEEREDTNLVCITKVDISAKYNNDCVYIISLSKCTDVDLEYFSISNQKCIILVDAKFDRVNINKLIKSNIKGLASLESTKDEILNCTYEVSKGNSYFSSDISTFFMMDSIKMSQFELSERESEILQLLSVGKTLSEISECLFLSKNTVVTHKRNILKKTGFNKMTQLIAWWSGNIS